MTTLTNALKDPPPALKHQRKWAAEEEKAEARRKKRLKAQKAQVKLIADAAKEREELAEQMEKDIQDAQDEAAAAEKAEANAQKAFELRQQQHLKRLEELRAAAAGSKANARSIQTNTAEMVVQPPVAAAKAPPSLSFVPGPTHSTEMLLRHGPMGAVSQAPPGGPPLLQLTDRSKPQGSPSHVRTGYQHDLHYENETPPSQWSRW